MPLIWRMRAKGKAAEKTALVLINKLIMEFQGPGNGFWDKNNQEYRNPERVIGLRACSRFLLLDFLMEPHRHKLRERNSFAAGDTLSHRKVEWVHSE